MITIEQCRGARGLLGWTQQDLADTSGLSKTAINNFEKGHSDIKTESLRAIRMAFESADIEFLERSGIRKKSEYARILRGEQALTLILQDIQETLKINDSDICISNVDSNITSQVSTQKLFAHIAFLKERNIRERVITTKGTTTILSPTDEVRWHPESENMGMPTFIYGGKLALQLWEQSMFIVINSSEAAGAERKRFETLWANAQVPKDAKYDEGQKSA